MSAIVKLLMFIYPREYNLLYGFSLCTRDTVTNSKSLVFEYSFEDFDNFSEYSRILYPLNAEGEVCKYLEVSRLVPLCILI